MHYKVTGMCSQLSSFELNLLDTAEKAEVYDVFHGAGAGQQRGRQVRLSDWYMNCTALPRVLPATAAVCLLLGRCCDSGTCLALQALSCFRACRQLAEQLTIAACRLPQIHQAIHHLKRGVGVHHSGLLPLLKEITEILFQEGLLKVRCLCVCVRVRVCVLSTQPCTA